ncbi:hypothetical protein [Pontibacter vulgaris]|uniref:hypothetical protein n=1 Tax=Pontibacter vulgaris TaxID=2905679 RepID=UPI001FA7C344|nr:hypothetical protein [Pontibacter vulgaris]
MDKHKYLIIKGCAGLGNRMYTLCSAISYAIKTNRKIYVDWSDGQYGEKGENIFYKYFSLNEVDSVNDLSEITRNIERLTFYPSVWQENLWASLYDLYLHDSGGIFQKIKKKYLGRGRLNILNEFWKYKTKKTQKRTDSEARALLALIDKRNMAMGGRYSYDIKQNVVFFSDFIPECDLTLLKTHICLKPIIEKRVEAFLKINKLSSGFIGVHVRYTDNKPDAALDGLIEHLKNLVDVENARIFLATDNIKIEMLFKNTFNEDLVCYPKYLPEKLSGGLHQYALHTGEYFVAEKIFQESLIELGILTRCTTLLYQGNSTFSQVAKSFRSRNFYSVDWLNLSILS